jgi:hypothetical protein
MGGVSVSQFSMCAFCRFSWFAPYPVHRVMVNWDPPTPSTLGWRQVPDLTMTEHGICPGAVICYTVSYSIYSGMISLSETGNPYIKG